MIKTKKQLIDTYIKFFKRKKHKEIANAPLVPENDPTVLFTTAGMHPLVQFILGHPHPQGNKLVNNQKCIRTGDIEEVGDETHLTFFEMLGNWSLNEYWKEEAITMSHEFLTSKKYLGLDKNKLHVTVFRGDKEIDKDEESAEVWQKLGIEQQNIHYLGRDDNFWGPAGITGPCGPCTEMFIDTGKKKCSSNCRPGCGCGKYFEIWNDVFMEYNKQSEKQFSKLKKRTVDTGMGVERTIAMLQKKKNIFEIEIFTPIINKIKKLTKKSKPTSKEQISIHIIADHIKAATFILAENISPSNLDRGYVLRRLIRKSIRHGRLLGINEFVRDIAEEIIKTHEKDYPHLKKQKQFILNELEREEQKFSRTLEKGLNKFEKIAKHSKSKISGNDAFYLYQSYGFPIEMTQELAKERKIQVDKLSFDKEFKKHQEISRSATEKRFKSGLADTKTETTRLHTATHLLHKALRQVLGDKVTPKGSNITTERLRFDFSLDRKMTDEEKKKVEQIINKQIKAALPIKKEEMTLAEAKKKGALAFFEGKYSEKVFVYSIGKFSKEVCAGPHVKNTKELGHFKIIKEESVGSGARRIKAILE